MNNVYTCNKTFITGGFGLVTIGGCKRESGFIDQSEAKMVVIYKKAEFSLVTVY